MEEEKNGCPGDCLLGVVSGAPVMLSNKEVDDGLVNGSIGMFRCFQRPKDEKIISTETFDLIYIRLRIRDRRFSQRARGLD